MATSGRATRNCANCGYVAITMPGTRDAAAAGPEEPHTAPFLEPASESELPTSIGAAGQLLRLPTGKRVAQA